MTDWPNALADLCADSFPTLAIFGNVDPGRSFNGLPTVEFNLNSVDTTTFISGATATASHIVAACRAGTPDDAATLAGSVRRLLFETLEELKSGGRLTGYAFDEIGTTADARGLVEGESFYGFVEFQIFEKQGF